jgi:hypothetical protein
MTLEHIDQMVRAANPVPDPTVLESTDAAPTTPDGFPSGLAELEPTPAGRTARRSVRVAVAAVVAVASVVAAMVLLGGDGEVRTQPANPTPSTSEAVPATTVALLPEGPGSVPVTGEMVAALNIRHRGVYRLYADGRLIQVWSRLEQRLTPEGVERVRSRFLSSGLFESAVPVSSIDELCAISACVRDGDQWLEVQVDVGGPSESRAPPEAVRLFDDLVNIDLWLPATEWVDAKVKPYVPGLIGTCFGMYVDGDPAGFDLDGLVSRLSEQAATVLAAHEQSAEMESLLLPLTRFDAGISSPIVEPESGCVELTLEEARTLANALLPPSGDGTRDDGITLRLGRQPDPSQPGATQEEAAHVWFFQVLPDKLPFDAFGD